LYKLIGNFHTGNFYCVVKDIFPMNIGSSVYTEYEFNKDFIKYRMENPESLDWELGHVHSHNTMSAFFSNTDTDELKNNAENHNYYLSLIVNNAFNPTAKIGFIGEEEVDSVYYRSFVGDSGKKFTIKEKNKNKKKVLFTYKCNIIWNNFVKVDTKFSERVDNIIKEKKEEEAKEAAKKKVVYSKPNPYDFNSEYNYSYQKETGYKNYAEVEKDFEATEDFYNTKTEEIIIDILMLEYKSDSVIQDALKYAIEEYKKDGSLYITSVGNFFRGMTPMYADTEEFSKEELSDIIEELMFWEEELGEELTEKLVAEILI